MPARKRLPDQSDVEQALERSETAYEATTTLRCTRDALKRAMSEYDIERPDYWPKSPQEAIRLARERTQGGNN